MWVLYLSPQTAKNAIKIPWAPETCIFGGFLWEITWFLGGQNLYFSMVGFWGLMIEKIHGGSARWAAANSAGLEWTSLCEPCPGVQHCLSIEA